MTLFDFQMVETSQKRTWFVFYFYGSDISQKVSRPWEGLHPYLDHESYVLNKNIWDLLKKKLTEKRNLRQIGFQQPNHHLHVPTQGTFMDHLPQSSSHPYSLDLSSVLLQSVPFLLSLSPHPVFTLWT